MEQSNYKILKGFPQQEIKIVSFGGQPYYSEGFLVQFYKSNGENWVANFKVGQTNLNYVYPLSSNQKYLVIAGGKDYIIDIEKEKNIIENQFEYLDNSFLLKNGSLLVFILDSIVIFDSQGQIWQSERISWDGFKNINFFKNKISGLSYNPVAANERWIPFEFDTETKSLKGGSFKKYKILRKKMGT